MKIKSINLLIKIIRIIVPSIIIIIINVTIKTERI